MSEIITQKAAKLASDTVMMNSFLPRGSGEQVEVQGNLEWKNVEERGL